MYEVSDELIKNGFSINSLQTIIERNKGATYDQHARILYDYDCF